MADIFVREVRKISVEGAQASVAANVATHSLLQALIEALALKGTLTNDEIRNVYKNALYKIEKGRVGAESELFNVYFLAGEIIEDYFRATDEDRASKPLM